MPSALLLDLDDTLVDDIGAMTDAVLQFRDRHGLVPNMPAKILTERWDIVGRELWRRMACGEVSFVEQRRQRLRLCFDLALTDAEADELFASYLQAYEQNWRLLPGALAFLEATDNLLRAIVTNGHHAHAMRKLSSLGLDRRFTAIVTPEAANARKPSPHMFLCALELLGASPSTRVMVGDNLEADIEPAIALGLRVFHVDPRTPGRTIPDAAGVA
jgi:putative hydrolase of the HAD superfamily